jgi:hypothetical protein
MANDLEKRVTKERKEERLRDISSSLRGIRLDQANPNFTPMALAALSRDDFITR